MQTFDTITDARNAIMDFRADHFDEVPERMRARFRELTGSPSPVDQIVGVGELLWANRSELGDAAKALGAGLIGFANTNAWHGLLNDNRGSRIVANLRKELGEIASAPAAPDPRPGYVIEAEAPPLPEAPAAPE